MRFTVGWTESAEQKLTRLWLSARDRQAIQEATAEVERVLATQPLAVGESRAGNFRIYFSGPLAVVYSVSVADRMVKVVEVTRTELGKSGNQD